jgi:MYXO-CTERM domain-containing protein
MIAGAAMTALSLGGIAANAATTVTPNPVSQGGTISITPDAACISAMAAVPTPDTRFWVLMDNATNRDAFGTASYSDGTVAMNVTGPPGSWELYGLDLAGGRASFVNSCGPTQVVIARSTGVPMVAGPPMVVAGAGAVVLCGLFLIRRRRSAPAA